MKRIKISLILLILQIIICMPCGYSQNTGKVTKYTVKDYLESNLPPQEGRKIVLDEITGLLTITDTPKNQELAVKLIKEWDISPKQVQIEAKFIEITFTDLDEMGVDWQMLRTNRPRLLLESALMGNSGASSAATFTEAAAAAGLGFFIGKATMTGSQLLAYLKALQESGKANLLHAPRITTLSGQMANIQVVRSFPYATSAERTQVDLQGTIYPVETYNIAEEITGITLEVTPIVVEGSNVITLEMHPEVSKLDQQVPISSLTAYQSEASLFPTNLGWPIISSRTAQTTVNVRSGDTLILGGLIQDKDDDTIERKIPFLGDAPLIGPLFRYKYEKREKKNLVIFLTARLINTEGEEIR